jgi:hypothetical protein
MAAITLRVMSDALGEQKDEFRELVTTSDGTRTAHHAE